MIRERGDAKGLVRMWTTFGELGALVAYDDGVALFGKRLKCMSVAKKEKPH